MSHNKKFDFSVKSSYLLKQENNLNSTVEPTLNYLSKSGCFIAMVIKCSQVPTSRS